MKIFAHRGFWLNEHERNTWDAFGKAFEKGYGVETDIRDLNGALVISHDMPKTDALPVSDFFSLYGKFLPAMPLALNIKADGLCNTLLKELQRFNVKNYFVFDMSVPDMLDYRANNVVFYTRHSEHEECPALLHSAKGVWIDSFERPWPRPEGVLKFIQEGYEVVIVSPELHKKPYKQAWDVFRAILMTQPQVLQSHVGICTDFPDDAADFFGNL